MLQNFFLLQFGYIFQVFFLIFHSKIDNGDFPGAVILSDEFLTWALSRRFLMIS